MRDELGLNELDGMADGDARAEKARRKLQQSELRAGELLSLGLAASSGTVSNYCEWCSKLHSHSSPQQAPADRPSACALAVGAAPTLQLSLNVLLWPGALHAFCRWAVINFAACVHVVCCLRCFLPVLLTRKQHPHKSGCRSFWPAPATE